MKKILVIMCSVVLALGAEAQPKIGGTFRGGHINAGNGGGIHYVRPRVTVVAPYTSFYPYYGPAMGYGLGFRYSPFYDPFYQRYVSRPTQLDLQIEDIRDEYKYKISAVKKDKSLAKDERKQQVRDLKHERDQEIIEAKKNYYSNRDNNHDS